MAKVKSPKNKVQSILKAVLDRLKQNVSPSKVKPFYFLKSLENATQGNIFEDIGCGRGHKIRNSAIDSR